MIMTKISVCLYLRPIPNILLIGSTVHRDILAIINPLEIQKSRNPHSMLITLLTA